jgi:hypothetical protein
LTQSPEKAGLEQTRFRNIRLLNNSIARKSIQIKEFSSSAAIAGGGWLTS